MVKNRKTKKLEKKQEVAGSKGLPSKSRSNPPVHGVDKASKKKGKSNEGKGVKKDEVASEALIGLGDSSVKKGSVLEQSNVPETHTDDHDLGLPSDGDAKFEHIYAFDASGELVQVGHREILSRFHTDDHDLGFPSDGEAKFEPVYAYDASGDLVQVGHREILSRFHTDDHDLGFPLDGDAKFEPVYAFDASGELVQVGDREILSRLSAEFQKMVRRHNDDDPYVYSDGDEFDAQEQREILREWLGTRLIMPDFYQPDESPVQESPDLNEKGSSNSSSDPPEEDSHKEMEETVISTKKNKNKKKKKKKKDKNKKQKETVVVMAKKERRKEPKGIVCVLCQSPSENMYRALKCGHYFCKNCILGYLHNTHKAVENFIGSVDCPEFDCKETLSDIEISDYIGGEEGFSWLTGKNDARLEKLEDGFTDLKNVAGTFLAMLNQIP